MSPTRAVFLGLVPVLLFNYVGFELQNGAAEEMENPQNDVPISVLRSGILGVLLYVIPILGIMLVLPAKAITGIGGFIDAVTTTFSVYGGAAHALLILMTICFVGTLVTSGAVWMIGSDRIQAVAAYDGAFFPWFGVFNRRFGTPVRVNVMSGIVVVDLLHQRDRVLQAAVTTRRSRRPRHRDLDDADLVPLDLPGRAASSATPIPTSTGPTACRSASTGIWIGSLLITGWVALGSWVAIFPGVLEKLFGVPLQLRRHAGASRVAAFEVYTLATLGGDRRLRRRRLPRRRRGQTAGRRRSKASVREPAAPVPTG